MASDDKIGSNEGTTGDSVISALSPTGTLISPAREHIE